MFIKVEKLNNDEYNVSKFKDEEILSTEMDDNIEQTIDASTYTTPVEILPTKDGMKKATITLSNIPTVYDLEANKSETINVSTYTEPIEITPTSGKDAMQKATIILENTVKKLYCWKFTITYTSSGTSSVNYVYFPFEKATELNEGSVYKGIVFDSSTSKLNIFEFFANSITITNDASFTKNVSSANWLFKKQPSSDDIEY